ncbi:MAG: hypothetical protein L3J36_01880 [Rhodobacteraceae bacterium]|nr:hypothetical protein [Paracoccaceae bacterium]
MTKIVRMAGESPNIPEHSGPEIPGRSPIGRNQCRFFAPESGYQTGVIHAPLKRQALFEGKPRNFVISLKLSVDLPLHNPNLS